MSIRQHENPFSYVGCFYDPYPYITTPVEPIDGMGLQVSIKAKLVGNLSLFSG